MGITLHTLAEDVGRRKIKRGAVKTALQEKDFRLAEEINYIQSRVAPEAGVVREVMYSRPFTS